jgi:hypothetical protein
MNNVSIDRPLKTTSEQLTTQGRLMADIKNCRVIFSVYAMGRDGADPSCLDSVAVEGKVRFHASYDEDAGNGRSFLTNVFEDPTWLQVCDITDKMIKYTETFQLSVLEALHELPTTGGVKDIRLGMSEGNNSPD